MISANKYHTRKVFECCFGYYPYFLINIIDFLIRVYLRCKRYSNIYFLISIFLKIRCCCNIGFETLFSIFFLYFDVRYLENGTRCRFFVVNSTCSINMYLLKEFTYVLHTN